MSAKVPTYLSLFSGCGGLDLGFEQAGFKGLLSVDIDKAALAVHELNISSHVRQMDLSVADPQITPRTAIDVLLAGSPCQGFSHAGARRVDDPRNSLLYVAPRVAAKYRPKVVVAENVPGALSGEHKRYWDNLHQQMRDLGYNTQDLHVDSSDFGVAQSRRRILMVAWRTKVHRNFHIPTQPRKTLGDVLVGLQGAHNHSPIFLLKGSNDFRIASKICQGQKLTNARSGDTAIHTWEIPEVFGRTTIKERVLLNAVLKLRRQARRRETGDADPISTRFLNKTYGKEVVESLVTKGYLRKIGMYRDLTNTFNGKYRRQIIDAPSRTVDTRFGDHRLFLHPLENRAFTVREAARIQGFPDNFVFSGATNQQFRMIGNAVPPPLGQHVATFLKSFL